MSASSLTTSKHNRWVPVIASICIQLCLGTAYIWGVFQSYLIISKATPNALFNWPATHGTFAYAALLLVLTLGSTIGGKIQDKMKHPSMVIMIGGIILGIGFFLAQFTTEATPWVLWISYGVLGGFGMGMAYTTTIATCQKWFPDRRGMVTGIIVSALGFGGLLFTPVAEYLINRFTVLSTFAIFGVVFIVVTVIGSMFIKNPPEGYKPANWTPPAAKPNVNVNSFSPGQALKTPQFYFLAIAFMCATAAGSMMIPMAKILGLQKDSGLTPQEAVVGVMIITACNSFGRLFWGTASDKIGRRRTILILMVLAFLSIMSISLTTGYVMLAVIAVIGFSYGGFLGVFPALTADFWGPKFVATNYGMLLVGFGIGAVASSFTVAYLSKNSKFSTAFLIAGIAAVLGFIIMFALKAPKIDEKMAASAASAVPDTKA